MLVMLLSLLQVVVAFIVVSLVGRVDDVDVDSIANDADVVVVAGRAALIGIDLVVR